MVALWKQHKEKLRMRVKMIVWQTVLQRLELWCNNWLRLCRGWSQVAIVPARWWVALVVLCEGLGVWGCRHIRV